MARAKSKLAARELAIGFDADDTLWHNENLFAAMHARFATLLAHHHEAATVERELLATELRNLDLYGYGVKSFTLSAIETAIHLSDRKISAAEIQHLLDLGRDMLNHPVELLDGVADTLAAIAAAGARRLLVITKGDLRDQQAKLARSGLAHHFQHVEVLADKNAATYADLLRRHAIAPENFLMVGNSLKSDILPVLALGGAGAHVPYHILWQHERTDEIPAASDRFFELKSLRELPAVISGWAEPTRKKAGGSRKP
jgi:putative hydrolase of the HAD superfamily